MPGRAWAGPPAPRRVAGRPQHQLRRQPPPTDSPIDQPACRAHATPKRQHIGADCNCRNLLRLHLLAGIGDGHRGAWSKTACSTSSPTPPPASRLQTGSIFRCTRGPAAAPARRLEARLGPEHRCRPPPRSHRAHPPAARGRRRPWWPSRRRRHRPMCVRRAERRDRPWLPGGYPPPGPSHVPGPPGLRARCRTGGAVQLGQ
jgi:hypothetical protein